MSQASASREKFRQSATAEAYQKYAACWGLAEEVEGLLAAPAHLRGCLPADAAGIQARHQYHLLSELISGRFFVREDFYLGGLKESINDEGVAGVKQALAGIGGHLEGLIEALKKEPLELPGYIAQGQSDEYKGRLHLAFGLMMFTRELSGEMLALLEELTHYVDGIDFALVYGLYALYDEEWMRRNFYNKG